MSVTTEQRICQADTEEHRHEVRNNLNVFIRDFLKRGEKHDLSKLQSPELELFTEHGPKLHTLTYSQEDYKESLKGLETALAHHYARNRHHPEHFENGVDDMNLSDICELFDWQANRTPRAPIAACIATSS